MRNLKESIFNDNDIIKDVEESIKYKDRITWVEVIDSKLGNNLGANQLLSSVWNKKNYDEWKKEFGFDIGPFKDGPLNASNVVKALFGCLSSPEQIQYVLNKWKFMSVKWKYDSVKNDGYADIYLFKGVGRNRTKIDVSVWIKQ